MKAYLSAGWFTDEQENARQDILVAMRKSRFDFYSPKDECLYKPGKDDPQSVFEENIKEIQKCDVVVASTAGKDMGALFECGVAHAIGKPIVYYWPNPVGNFNLMLSQSSQAVFSKLENLADYLKVVRETNHFPKTQYTGGIE